MCLRLITLDNYFRGSAIFLTPSVVIEIHNRLHTNTLIVSGSSSIAV